ncbi:MAG TPA: hypothetical protein VGY58_21905 [Gemmataceae bacterium]|nr:hypothetical protein [Gemmataceae bacterium]
MGESPATEPVCSAASGELHSWGPAVFVWGIWAGLVVAALLFVRHFGINLPQWDDYGELVPVLVGEKHITLKYLWSQHNEHRIVIPRLLQWGLTRLGGGNFVGGMFFDVLACALLAAGLMCLARSRRGELIYADAFFPVLLLHWGHWGSFLQSDTTGNVLSTVLACMILGIMVQQPKALPLGRAGLVGLSLLLLPLCGANGLVIVPLLAAWLAYAGIRRWRLPAPHARRNGAAMMALAAAAFAEVVLYFVNFSHGPAHSERFSATLGAAGEFLANGLGYATLMVWPSSGFLVLGALLSSVAVLATTWYRRPEQRFRAAGLLAFIATMLVLALALGWGRAALGGGFAPRYVILACPVFCALYFVWELYGPRRIRGLLPMCLFVIVALLTPWNYQHGLGHAQQVGALARAFRKDLRHGVPPAELARRHPFLCPDVPVLTRHLEKLIQRGIGPFRTGSATLHAQLPH